MYESSSQNVFLRSKRNGVEELPLQGCSAGSHLLRSSRISCRVEAAKKGLVGEKMPS